MKNRDKKRTNARIFSSGAGGGGSVQQIDKRTLEHPCPHCDRIFKQTGRLKEHVARHHPEAEQATASEEAPVETKSGIVVQDVGSKNAFYTHRSPKLLLLEWCKKRQRRKPIYRRLPSGSFKIVLPDSKDANKDIVVYLDRQFVQGEDGEIQQRGATAALCHVAGNSALHRSLPPQYLSVWDYYMDRQIASEKQKLQEEEKKPTVQHHRREPHPIVMSQSKQEFLEKTLMALNPLNALNDLNGTMPATWNGMRDRLEKEGFERRDIERAILFLLRMRRPIRMETVLDWLCFYLKDGELPKAYNKRSKTQKVDVVKFSQEEDVQELELSETEDPDIDQLLQYGYALPEIIQSLEATCDPRSAHRLLFEKLTGVQLGCPVEELIEGSVWKDELDALVAIYEDAVSILDPSSVEITIDIPDALLRNQDSEIWKRGQTKDCRKLVLFVGGIAEDYPSSLPLLAVSCRSMRYGFLRYLTMGLTEKGQELMGMPMTHALIDALGDLLHEAADPGFSLPGMEKPSMDAASESEEEEIEEEQGMDVTDNESVVPRRPTKERRGHPSGPRLQPGDIERIDRALQLHQRELESSPPSSIFHKRKHLPAARLRLQIVDSVRRCPVVVITGMTACGKSSQVPQFLLEDKILEGQGAHCHIICTQPRRIAAISLASRVAEEREESVGGTIGYAVKNQHRSTDKTRIQYCTTGILLRRFISDPSLSGLTHVIVDEVHERTVEMDLLLLLLKALLQKSLNHPRVLCPKIVLMSATANAEDFQSYFSRIAGDVPIVSIPGMTFPVREFFLEDVRLAIDGSMPPTDDASTDDETKTRSSTDDLEVPYNCVEQLVAYILKQEYDHGSDFLLASWPEASTHRSTTLRPNGTVLVFLPGTNEIHRLCHVLQSSPLIPSYLKPEVLPLHASLSAEQQRRVFLPSETSRRRIVVSTNVAETSVTIPDVTAVIDICLAKELEYDPVRKIARLKTTRISRASAKQRTGRAGRVQCGVCFRLIGRRQWDEMAAFTQPEIVRTPLESLCLTVVQLLGSAASMRQRLSECLTPPGERSVTSAVTTLRDVGALTSDDRLTPLGRHLARMPVDVHLGKMLIYGSLLRCVDSTLTLAASMSYGRSLFVAPMDKREEADAVKREINLPYANAKSDHMAVVAAVQEFRKADMRKGSNAFKQFCRDRFLSIDALSSILETRQSYARILADLGFVSDAYAKNISEEAFNGDAYWDAFSANSRCVRAALCAGFYPNLVRVQHPPKKYAATIGGSKLLDADSRQIKFFDREKRRVFLHPSSVNFKSTSFESEWLVYSDILETGKIYVRQSSMVPIYAMLVFSDNQVQLRHKAGLLTLPSWKATFKVHPKVGVMIKMLRSSFEEILIRRIEHPDADTIDHPILEAALKLLETDGF